MEIVKINNDTNYSLDEKVIKDIVTLERQIKEAKEIQDKYKQAILEEMEKNNIIKIDIPEMLISYVASTDREDFDKKKFKQEHQDLYDEYVKMTPVKSSIRIKVKDNG